MAWATARTVSLSGSAGHVIDVSADVSAGMVGTTLVGRADVTLNEARDRCRMAMVNSGFGWPTTRRVTILLAPADLAKRGSHFDLAIATATLGAVGALTDDLPSDVVFLGELGLDGGLRCVTGVLPMVMAAAAQGLTRVVVPEPQAREAALVPGVTVLGVRSLAQVVALLNGVDVPEAPPVPAPSGRRLLQWRGEDRVEELDLADVVGLADAKFAVEVAAAGGHHLLLSGPKGCGKTTLAERIVGVLPDLTREEALEITAIHSLAGALDQDQALVTRPPYFAPHHDASRASLLGGGTGKVRPGELSRAHAGVLLLDEFPLFHADVIDALRQPLESGEITVARGEESATFPARGIVVLACNPCPCGDYHPTDRQMRCVCSAVQRRDYWRRIRGPVSDRIDVTRHLQPAGPHHDTPVVEPRESTAVVRARVGEARERQALRWSGRSWRLNGQAPGPVLQAEFPLADDGARWLDTQVYQGKLSRRGATRVHRLAWTLADLWGDSRPELEHVSVAFALRTGDSVPVAAIRRSAALVAEAAS